MDSNDLQNLWQKETMGTHKGKKVFCILIGFGVK